MRIPGRAELASDLRAALSSPEPAKRVTALLRQLLATEPSMSHSEEQQLVRRIGERVDVAAGDDARLLAVARDVQTLLEGASSPEAVELLLELMAERERVSAVLRKYARGTISRTSFLSYLGEQRWPERIRRRVAVLSPNDVAELVRALEVGSSAQLEELLIA